MRPWHTDEVALVTDLYELTMAQAYLQAGKAQETATFSLFIRQYPPHRGYFVACGLADVVRFLEDWRFSPAAIEALHRTGRFAEDFLDYLKGVRFTGEVRAIPEGRLFFVDEPVVEVTAPVIEAQLVETVVLNHVHFQSVIATKAARCVHAAQGRALVDYSLRRTHGLEAGMKVARASYLAGFAGTSNVLAGEVYGIPIVGTMAHAYISSFPQEIEAFRAFARSFPAQAVLLIDTYDTIAGAYNAVQVAQELAARGQRLRGVRIDSGDLLTLGREVRRILDTAGVPDVQLVGSGGLGEFELAELSRQHAPYDSYGVGTRLGVSADAPAFDMAYKLVRYAERPVLKLSPGKATLPDAKQVYRVRSAGGLAYDVIARRDEVLEEGEPLLQPVMEAGRRLAPLPSLAESRERFLREFARLDARYKAVEEPDAYSVALSLQLGVLQAQLQREIAEAKAIAPPERAPDERG
jgi:nicotinate phosphoribosyltransferase